MCYNISHSFVCVVCVCAHITLYSTIIKEVKLKYLACFMITEQKNCTKLAMKIGAVGFQGLKEID